MTEIPIGYVGVVVSYVGREHLDVSGDAFTHGDLVARGRKGVWVEPLLPGKHPINTRVMKVELVPTTNIVLNWAHAHRGAPLRRAPVADHRALEGRLRLLARRLADHPHRHEERAARDLARRLDAEPGRPRAAADGGQLLPQLGAGGRRVLEFLSARSERQQRGVRQHQGRDRGLRRRVHRHADRRHRAAGRADEDADRPQDRRRAAAHLRGAARGAGAAPGRSSARRRSPTCRPRSCAASSRCASPSAHAMAVAEARQG